MRKFFALPSLPIVLFFLSVASRPASSQLSFDKLVIDRKFAGAYSVCAVDLDRDGKTDVLAGGSSGVAWWKNDGRGNFSKRTIGSLSGTWWVYAADIDRDGDYDVLGTSPKLKRVQFFENRGGESFASYTVGDGINAETVFAADLDRDGDLDVLATDWDNNDVVCWKYNGGRRFARYVLDGNLKGAHSVTAADFDLDGDVDVAASGSGKINLYRNNGSGSFSSAITIGSGGSLCIHATDFDRDGNPDILGTGRRAGDVFWYEGGGGRFSKHTIATGFGDSWSVHAVDIDGDGDMDAVAAAILDNYVKAWINDGSDTKFKEYLVDGDIKSARAAWAADFDGDGDADIISAARKSGQVAWYRVSRGAVGRVAEQLPDRKDEDDHMTAALMPESYALGQNYPNPFNAETRIEYDLPEKGEVRLVIYDVLGREVRILVWQDQPADHHVVAWNGCDNGGQRVSSGMYFYHLQAGGYSATKKMLMVQ